MQLTCREPIELRSGAYAARLAPEAGGRIASLTWRQADSAVPLLVEWDGRPFGEHDWPTAGAFPMLPFTNRLPRQGFPFDGSVIRPPAGPRGFAVHGFAHRRPWQVIEASPDRALLRYTHDAPREGWAWSFVAEQEVTLGEEGLCLELRVRNESAGPMPLAMGWHPYHPAVAVTAGDLEFEAQGRCELDAEGSAGGPEREAQFGMRRGETAAYAHWTGGARLSCAHEGTMVISCKGADHLVLHRPSAGEHLCIEPVTVLPGQLGGPNRDAGALLPGATRQVTWTCAYRPF